MISLSLRSSSYQTDRNANTGMHYERKIPIIVKGEKQQFFLREAGKSCTEKIKSVF
jgi:hypothetical protein